MAVYTHVSDEALAAFLLDYELGEAVSFKGIAEGVENSNYYLETSAGRFILTLFEKRVKAQDLPYFIGLKQHLAGQGFSCPLPIAGRDGECLRQISGRPALIISFLPGLSPDQPNLNQAFALGQGLAGLHQAGLTYKGRRENTLGPTSWPGLWQGREAQAEALEKGLREKIEADLQHLNELDRHARALPAGTIHADLFPDNAFFIEDELTGIIDFYFACTGPLAYDLAICINAWAFGPDHVFNPQMSAELIRGYQSLRKLNAEEKQALPQLCLGGAMRFFLTRLIDWSDTPADALVRPKNPLDYARRLSFHRQVTDPALYGLS